MRICAFLIVDLLLPYFPVKNCTSLIIPLTLIFHLALVQVLFAKCTCELLVNTLHGKGMLFKYWQTYLVCEKRLENGPIFERLSFCDLALGFSLWFGRSVSSPLVRVFLWALIVIACLLFSVLPNTFLTSGSCFGCAHYLGSGWPCMIDSFPS